MLALNLLAIPLVILWLPPWWVIYVLVIEWISHLLLYYYIVQMPQSEQDL